MRINPGDGPMTLNPSHATLMLESQDPISKTKDVKR